MILKFEVVPVWWSTHVRRLYSLAVLSPVRPKLVGLVLYPARLTPQRSPLAVPLAVGPILVDFETAARSRPTLSPPQHTATGVDRRCSSVTDGPAYELCPVIHPSMLRIGSSSGAPSLR